MSIDLKTARPCERCASPGVPYGMHACKECRALYCTPACAVADWRSGGHRRTCTDGRNARFVADVVYSLRASHLTACVLCSCGGRKPNLDPRLRALGLEPVSVVHACAGAYLCAGVRECAHPCVGECVGAISVAADQVPPTLRAAAIASAIAAETDRRAECDVREFEALFDLLARAIRSGSINVDAKAVQRFWKVCRLLFKSLIRMPTGAPASTPASAHAITPASAHANEHVNEQASTPASAHASEHASTLAVHDDLLAILRKWADVGQKCADMFAESHTPATVDGIDYQLVFRALQESIGQL